METDSNNAKETLDPRYEGSWNLSEIIAMVLGDKTELMSLIQYYRGKKHKYKTTNSVTTLQEHPRDCIRRKSQIG
jgi:hypothetical protein